jgi:rubrerythrin
MTTSDTASQRIRTARDIRRDFAQATGRDIDKTPLYRDHAEEIAAVRAAAKEAAHAWRCPGCGYRADQHNRGRSCAVMQHLGPPCV